MRVLVDMDGVLVDFHKAWAVHHNVIPDWSKGYDLIDATNITEEDCWKGISESWWENLNWTSDGQEILKVIEKHFQPNEICLVTRPPWYENAHGISPSGKVAWLVKNLPQYLDRFMIGTHRHWMANDHTILVDDSTENCEKFIYNGGRAILIPRSWNRLANQYVNIGAYLEYNLSILIPK